MIHDLKPYPAMKDSGVPWLGQVPEHWDVTRSKWLFSSSKALALPDDVQLSATQAYGVIPQDEYERRSGARVVKISMHLDKRKHVEKDDFIISMRSFQGGLERAWASGAIRSSYVVLKPGPGVNVGCFSYLLKSHDYIRALQTTGGFIRDGQDLTESDFRKVDLPLIPLDEQAAIVRFLDHADRRIRRTIAGKQRLIKLLQEQKQVIIHQAVTRGLNPDAKLKPSGVEWLGDVPEGWEATSFTRCTIERADYRGATPAKTEAGIFLVTAKNVRRGWIDYEASKEYIAEDDYALVMRRGLPKLGDLLFTTEAPLGHAALVDREDVALAQRVIRFRFDPERCNPEFILRAVLSPYFQRQVLRRGTGSTALGIKASKLPELFLLLPPLDEQESILAHILVQTMSLDSGAERTAQEIALLREYRTRLIADVVTGKLDVREAVAALPDLDAEPLPADPELEDGDLEGEDTEAEADTGEMVEA